MNLNRALNCVACDCRKRTFADYYCDYEMRAWIKSDL